MDLTKNESKYDVIIVGAGPAGTSCAFFLAQRGLNVLILEKERFPREKVCGDCLTPTGVDLACELGVYPEISKEGTKIRGVRIITALNTINTTFFRDAGLEDAIVIRRYNLDFLLLKNAEKAGATIIEGAEVVDVNSEEDTTSVVRYTANGKEYIEKSKYVVIACGGGAPLLKKSLNIKYDCYRAIGVAIRGYFELNANVGEFMELLAQPEHWPALGWIFPVSNNLVNAGIGFYLSEKTKIKDATLSGTMKALIKEGWYSRKILESAKLLSPLRAKRLCMGGLMKKPAIKNIFLIGEAAGLVNPFTGEGIAHALLSGKLAGESISEAIQKDLSPDYAANTYVKKLQKELLSYYNAAIFLRGFAKNWTITDKIVKILNAFPTLSAFNIKYWVKA